MKLTFLMGAILLLALFLVLPAMAPDLELGGLEPVDVSFLVPAADPVSPTAESPALFSDLVPMEYSAPHTLLSPVKNESRNAASATLFHGTARQSDNLRHNLRGLNENKFICLA